MEVFVPKITPWSLNSKFSLLFRSLSLGPPDQDPGKFMFASPAIDGGMFIIQAHISWYDELARFLSLSQFPQRLG